MIGAHVTVTASTMITRFYLGRKVRCHMGAVEIPRDDHLPNTQSHDAGCPRKTAARYGWAAGPPGAAVPHEPGYLARRCRRSRLVATDFSKESKTLARTGPCVLRSRFLRENAPCFLMSYKDAFDSPVCWAISGIGVPRNASVSAKRICFPYSVSSTAFHLRIPTPQAIISPSPRL
jgi:hypothetical protein